MSSRGKSTRASDPHFTCYSLLKAVTAKYSPTRRIKLLAHNKASFFLYQHTTPQQQPDTRKNNMPSFLDGYNASVLAIPAYLIRMYMLSLRDYVGSVV